MLVATSCAAPARPPCASRAVLAERMADREPLFDEAADGEDEEVPAPDDTDTGDDTLCPDEPVIPRQPAGWDAIRRRRTESGSGGDGRDRRGRHGGRAGAAWNRDRHRRRLGNRDRHRRRLGNRDCRDRVVSATRASRPSESAARDGQRRARVGPGQQTPATSRRGCRRESQPRRLASRLRPALWAAYGRRYDCLSLPLISTHS